MISSLELRISYAYKPAKVVHASSRDILSDILEENNILPPPHQYIVALHNGKVINQYMTLGFQGITNNSHIILVNKIKKLPCTFRANSEFSYYDLRKEEIARINDIAFNGWELHPDYNLMMQAVMDYNNQLAPQVEQPEQIPFKLDYESKISVTPLPDCYDPTEKARYLLKKKLEADEAEQNERSNNKHEPLSL